MKALWIGPRALCQRYRTDKWLRRNRCRSRVPLAGVREPQRFWTTSVKSKRELRLRVWLAPYLCKRSGAVNECNQPVAKLICHILPARAFPDYTDSPSLCQKGFDCSLIPGLVSLQLRQPVVLPSRRHRCALASSMLMPEASVDKNGYMMLCEHQIRPAWKLFRMQPVAIPCSKDN